MISSFAQWASSQLETHEIRVQFMLGDKYLNDLQVFLLALLRRRSILWDYHGLRPSCHANIRTYNYYWWDNRIVQEWPISKAIWGTQSSYNIISASNVFFYIILSICHVESVDRIMKEIYLSTHHTSWLPERLQTNIQIKQLNSYHDPPFFHISKVMIAFRKISDNSGTVILGTK